VFFCKFPMKPVTRAAVSVLAKAPINSVREALRSKSKSEDRYLVCLAHPDDEILIGGLCSRLMKYSEDPRFVVATNGAGNTDKDRVSELMASYGFLGYSGGVECLMNERDVYDSAKSERGGVASVEDMKKLAGIVRSGISGVERKITDAKANVVITNAFEGGHFAHDLTNFMVFMAAQRTGARVYETSQYSLVPLPDASEIAIHEAINKPEVPIDPHAIYRLGVPLIFSGGLDDPALGVRSGILNVNISDVILKNKMRGAHKSQTTSLNRSSVNITHADFSHETFAEVPLDRTFFELPGGALPLYEFCDWRPTHLTFDTFRKLVEIINSN
jgi:LmbE family N-acetylglucosaminyl deacetylase